MLRLHQMPCALNDIRYISTIHRRECFIGNLFSDTMYDCQLGGICPSQLLEIVQLLLSACQRHDDSCCIQSKRQVDPDWKGAELRGRTHVLHAEVSRFNPLYF